MPFQAKRDIAGRHQNCSGYLSTVPKENGEETYVRNVSNKDTVIYSPQDDTTINEK